MNWAILWISSLKIRKQLDKTHPQKNPSQFDTFSIFLESKKQRKREWKDEHDKWGWKCGESGFLFHPLAHIPFLFSDSDTKPQSNPNKFWEVAATAHFNWMDARFFMKKNKELVLKSLVLCWCESGCSMWRWNTSKNQSFLFAYGKKYGKK